MEQLGAYILTFVENGGLFAPILFIGFHLLRPLLFIPVIFICVSGGILFGTLAGTIYSLIGITLSSLLFYYIVPVAPNTFKKTHPSSKKTNERFRINTLPNCFSTTYTVYSFSSFISMFIRNVN